MQKRYLYILVVLGLLVAAGLLTGIKALQIKAMISQGAAFSQPPETVTSAVVSEQSWESVVTAVGTLEAVQGIEVTAEVTGRVVAIAFTPGTGVAAGDLLVQQDISVETAQLHAAEAAAELARLTFERESNLLKKQVNSQSDYDSAKAQLTQAAAAADNIRAVIARKTIRAPFAGRLGLRMINMGQILTEGQPIVSLQALDKLYANFSVPQQQLGKMQKGYTVRVRSDAFQGKDIIGVISAVNPDIDQETRSLKVQATLENSDGLLRPGMYVNVEVVLPAREEVLTIPATAVLYAPYSDSVFVIEKNQSDGGEERLEVRQQFIRLGEKRGDFIAVDSGLRGDETIVSTGAFKLRNGQTVIVNNSLAPEFKLNPRPPES